MALGTPLSELRRLLRAETGQSLNTAQGVNAQGQYDMILFRQQKELWEQYEWPHLALRVDIPVSAGQDIYPYPAEMPFSSINKVYCWDNVETSQPSFAAYPIPNETFSSVARSWPVQYWQNKAKVVAGKTIPAGELKVWPVPIKAGSLIVLGQAPVNALVADTDTAVLDDTLVTLFASAEILAQQKNEGASVKLQKANQFLRRLLANQGGDKRRIHVLGGANILEAMAGPEYSGQRFRVAP